MSKITLPTGIVGDEDLPRLQESLKNLFHSPSEGSLLKTPGITQFSTGNGKCRGAVTFRDEYYQVSGADFIKVFPDGTTEVIGQVGGIEFCAIAISFIAIMIVVKGGSAYAYIPDGEGFVEITDAEYRPSIDVESINQRFVFVPEDGGTLFYTNPNTPTEISALNFFDAELLPDGNTGVINLRNDLYVGGVDSFEVFRDTGDVDAPFQRVDGAAVLTGYVAAKAFYKDTFLFLGKDKDGSYGFHAMAQGDSPKISNTTIDEILNEDYTAEELSECVSQRFTWKGIDMVAFRLEYETLLFFGTGWSRMQTGITPAGQYQPWDINCVTFAYGRYITGCASMNEIGILENISTEFGEKIEREIVTFIKGERNSYFTLDNLFLSCITGTSDINGTVGLQISKDGLTYPQAPKYRPLGEVGRYQQQIAWYGGLGLFEFFCGLRIRTTAAVDFDVEGLFFNA